MRAGAPALLLGSMLLIGCDLPEMNGSSEEIVVEVEPPLHSARISSYTGFFPGPWHQEIWVELAEGVELGEVVDLSVFGGVHPGMGLDDAIAALGPPAGQRTDYREDKWNYWTTAYGTVELSCREDCSGFLCTDPYWDLRARPDNFSAAALLHPSVAALVARGEESKPEGEYRAVHLSLWDSEEMAGLVLVSRWERYLRWWHGNQPCE